MSTIKDYPFELKGQRENESMRDYVVRLLHDPDYLRKTTFTTMPFDGGNHKPIGNDVFLPIDNGHQIGVDAEYVKEQLADSKIPINGVIDQPKAMPFEQNGVKIGETQNGNFYYSNQMAPDSPLNDDYLTDKGFDLYVKDQKMSAQKSADAKPYHFQSVEQVKAFGKAVCADKESSLWDIKEAAQNIDHGLENKNIYGLIENNIPDTPEWEDQKDVWTRLGMEGKIMQDEKTKKAVKAIKDYTIIDASMPSLDMDNDSAKIMNNIVNKLNKQGAFDNELQSQKQRERSKQHVAVDDGNELQQAQLNQSAQHVIADDGNELQQALLEQSKQHVVADKGNELQQQAQRENTDSQIEVKETPNDGDFADENIDPDIQF